MFADAVISGILIGGLYALVASGFSLAFGFTRILNLAHGEIIVISSYLSYSLFKSLDIDPFLSLPLLLPSFFLVGFIAYRWLSVYVSRGGFEGSLLLFLAISTILQNSAILLWTPNQRSITLEYTTLPFNLLGIRVPTTYMFDFIIGTAFLMGLHIFLTRTRTGKAIRAVPQDPEMASTLGINSTLICQIAFGLAFMACAAAGVLMATTFTFNPTSGLSNLLIALAVVVLGGLGSIVGCLLSGFIIGVGQSLGAYFFGSGVQLLFGYIIFLVVLLIRPKGLLGRYVL